MRKSYFLFIVFVVMLFGGIAVNTNACFTPAMADQGNDKGECRCPQACKCGHCLGKGVKCKCGH